MFPCYLTQHHETGIRHECAVLYNNKEMNFIYGNGAGNIRQLIYFFRISQ